MFLMVKKYITRHYQNYFIMPEGYYLFIWGVFISKIKLNQGENYSMIYLLHVIFFHVWEVNVTSHLLARPVYIAMHRF